MNPIRVLLVDDSPMAIEIIRRMLAGAPEIVIVGTASNGLQALALLPQVRPDVICTDLHMPVMDGLTLTQKIMAQQPLPILVLSVSVQAEQAHKIFQMLEAGALDIMAKPRCGLQTDIDVSAHDLIKKIRVLSGVKVIGKHGATTSGVASLLPSPWAGLTTKTPRLIGIGASTGGPQAFDAILRPLPDNFPLPLLCVQHIAEGFMQGLVDWLASACRIRVCTAEDGTEPQPGVAYFPPNDRHLEIDTTGRFHCASEQALGGYRPSVDRAFSSLAHYYGADSAGVLLTGMGQDGAQGLLEISHAGGVTIAQDESSSVIFGMPRSAIELGAARHVMALNQISLALCGLATRREYV